MKDIGTALEAMKQAMFDAYEAGFAEGYKKAMDDAHKIITERFNAALTQGKPDEHAL